MENDEIVLYDRERDGELTDDILINIIEVSRKTQFSMNNRGCENAASYIFEEV